MKLMGVEKAASNKNSVMYYTWRCFVFGNRLPPVYSAEIKCGFSLIGANGSNFMASASFAWCENCSWFALV